MHLGIKLLRKSIDRVALRARNHHRPELDRAPERGICVYPPANPVACFQDGYSVAQMVKLPCS